MGASVSIPRPRNLTESSACLLSFRRRAAFGAKRRGAFADGKYAGLLSVNLDWDRLQALLASMETRLEGAVTKESMNAVRLPALRVPPPAAAPPPRGRARVSFRSRQRL